MSSLQSVLIAGNMKGLQTNVKPWLLPDEAFQYLYNAYVFRDRVKKREAVRSLGRLQRILATFAYFPSQASPWTFNILNVSGYVTGANNANPGQITTSAPETLVNGDSVMISGVGGATGYNTNSPFTITVVDSTHFTVGTNAGGYGAYTSGGFW